MSTWLWVLIGILSAFVIAVIIVLVYDAISEHSYKKRNIEDRIMILEIKVNDLQSLHNTKTKKKTTK